MLGGGKEKEKRKRYLNTGCVPGTAPDNSQRFPLKRSQHPHEMDYTHFIGEDIEVIEIKSQS